MIELWLVASLAQAVPHPCVHRPDQRRPRVTAGEQRLTRRLIAHVVDRAGGSDDLVRLLTMVAEREASWQLGLVHQLPEDVSGSRSAWAHTRRLYTGNPLAEDASVWLTYGLFGMNSNYFTVLWDRTADPRALCDAVVDVLVYRRALVRALRRLASPVRCDGKPVIVRPTWAALHAAVSGGRICPKDEGRMRRRATRFGLDADRLVKPADLGHEPLAPDGETWSQDAMLRGLWAELSATTGA